MPTFRSTKTYDHNIGFSCAFRQWRADSHCSFLHGYPLNFKFTFEATHLDERNWVVGYGDLKEIKQWLEHMFDHTTCVAADDPELETFEMLHAKKMIDLRVLEGGVGCEKTAEFVGIYVDNWVRVKTNNRCWLQSVEVREHSANSAIYFPGVS